MLPFFFSWRYNPHRGLYFTALWRALASSLARFHDHTQRRATVGRTPLNEWSVRRRDLYLTTQNTHNRQTSKPRVGFEPTISEGEWSNTYALDHAATGSSYNVNQYDISHKNYITICISIFAGHYTICWKNLSLTLLNMGKRLSKTCCADLGDL